MDDGSPLLTRRLCAEEADKNNSMRVIDQAYQDRPGNKDIQLSILHNAAGGNALSVVFKLRVKQGISGTCRDEQTVQASGQDNLEIRTDGRGFWRIFRMPRVSIRVRQSKRLR
jgi:hypothetical protein